MTRITTTSEHNDRGTMKEEEEKPCFIVNRDSFMQRLKFSLRSLGNRQASDPVAVTDAVVDILKTMKFVGCERTDHDFLLSCDVPNKFANKYGNIIGTKLIADKADLYNSFVRDEGQQTTSDVDNEENKQNLIRFILGEFRRTNRRFLKQIWVPMCDEEQRKKTGHFLRDSSKSTRISKKSKKQAETKEPIVGYQQVFGSNHLAVQSASNGTNVPTVPQDSISLKAKMDAPVHQGSPSAASVSPLVAEAQPKSPTVEANPNEGTTKEYCIINPDDLRGRLNQSFHSFHQQDQEPDLDLVAYVVVDALQTSEYQECKVTNLDILAGRDPKNSRWPGTVDAKRLIDTHVEAYDGMHRAGSHAGKGAKIQCIVEEFRRQNRRFLKPIWVTTTEEEQMKKVEEILVAETMRKRKRNSNKPESDGCEGQASQKMQRRDNHDAGQRQHRKGQAQIPMSAAHHCPTRGTGHPVSEHETPSAASAMMPPAEPESRRIESRLAELAQRLTAVDPKTLEFKEIISQLQQLSG